MKLDAKICIVIFSNVMMRNNGKSLDTKKSMSPVQTTSTASLRAEGTLT